MKSAPFPGWSEDCGLQGGVVSEDKVGRSECRRVEERQDATLHSSLVNSLRNSDTQHHISLTYCHHKPRAHTTAHFS